MIKYVLYETMFYNKDGVNKIITISELAKNYGLKLTSNKVLSVKLGRPQDEPVNTDKIAYIHLYPQMKNENYIKIKNELINVRN